MKLFMSSEIGFLSEEQAASFGKNRNSIEKIIKSLIESKDYGSIDLAIIPTMYPKWMHDKQREAGKEIKERKLLRKDRADYRLFIDHAAFVDGDEEKRKLLILDNVLRVIQDLHIRIKKGFDAGAFEKDIRKEFNLPLSGSIL